jgi:HlyD family secretion protein
MQQQKLFRKAALEKLSSPEQLDVMMQVTSPMGWLALIGLGAMLAFVVVWSVIGSISTKVDGMGILIRGSNILDVSTSASGRVEQIMVQPGDLVKKGQVIAKISQPDLLQKIENTKDEIADAVRQAAERGSRGGNIVAQYQAQLGELRARLATQQKMVDRGLLTRQSMMRTQEQIIATQQMIASAQMTTEGSENRVDGLRRQLKELETRLASSDEVTSPYDGRVLEVVVDPGNVIGGGSRLVSLEQTEGLVEAKVYIPPTEGKKVRPGMVVRISPSTVKAEEYGFIIGEVRSVSQFPVTPEALRRVLRNDALVDTFAKDSAPIEVVARLIPQKGTPSGYKWSSSQGPPTQIFSGTMCTASVVVETKKPISYVLPIFKNALN